MFLCTTPKFQSRSRCLLCISQRPSSFCWTHLNLILSIDCLIPLIRSISIVNISTTSFSILDSLWRLARELSEASRRTKNLTIKTECIYPKRPQRTGFGVYFLRILGLGRWFLNRRIGLHFPCSQLVVADARRKHFCSSSRGEGESTVRRREKGRANFTILSRVSKTSIVNKSPN